VSAHRIPLKRRLAEIRYRGAEVATRKDGRFLYGIHGVDKLRDIPVALTMRLYWDVLVVEGPSGSAAAQSNAVSSTAPNAGANSFSGLSSHPTGLSSSVASTAMPFPMVLSLRDPAVQEWLDWVEDGRLHPALVSWLYGHPLAIYYDGCLLVAIHDYRNASANVSAAMSDAPGLLFHTMVQESRHVSQPEVHRLLLRPNEATLAQDITLLLDEQYGHGCWRAGQYLEMEEKVRNILTPQPPPLYLEPNPNIAALVRAAHRHASASLYRPFRRHPWTRAHLLSDLLETNHSSGANGPPNHTLSNWTTSSASSSVLSPSSAFFSTLSNTLLDLKIAKKARDMEPFHGLDTKKLPSRMYSCYLSL
jgi:hypothetical protein